MSYPSNESRPSSPPPTETPQQGGDGRSTRSVSTGQILAGVLFVIVIVFVVENTRTVRVRLLFPEVRAPLAVALLIAAVLGALVSALMRIRRQHRRARDHVR